MVLGTHYGLGNLECGLENLKVSLMFSLSYASYFAKVSLCLGLYMLCVNFEKSASCVVKKQKPPHKCLDCLKGVFRRKAQVGCG